MTKIYSLKFLLALLILLSVYSTDIFAQGCVAIRGYSGCSNGMSSGAILMPGESQVGMNFRYFKSFRHFRGSHEEPERIENNTEVINNSYFLDFNINFAIAERLYTSLSIPFVYHERSSLYEHGGNSFGDRHKTYSQGIADMRVSLGYWLLNQEKYKKGNLAVALGLKMPTGDYKATGTFYNVGENGEPVNRVVDQSIQPGDGGWGTTVELQGYRMLNDYFAMNGNLFYLFNPQETNGIERRPGSDQYFSVPDQFGVRFGFNYITPIHGVDFYLGGRAEGVPSNDLIGSSAGYRRPGYAISIEPGINISYKGFVLNTSVPVALHRNRTQSYLDKERERETGEPRHGDAAFADYLINVGLSYRFSSLFKSHRDMEAPQIEINQ